MCSRAEEKEVKCLGWEAEGDREGTGSPPMDHWTQGMEQEPRIKDLLVCVEGGKCNKSEKGKKGLGAIGSQISCASVWRKG